MLETEDDPSRKLTLVKTHFLSPIKHSHIQHINMYVYSGAVTIVKLGGYSRNAPRNGDFPSQYKALHPHMQRLISHPWIQA
jgi:hypothetical protein